MAVFIDTNVLVHLYDDRDPVKKRRANALFDRLVDTEKIVISSQVVQEFISVVLKKLPTQTMKLLPDIVKTFLQELVAHAPTVDFYLRALELQQRYQLYFYDALIVQAALDLGCTTLYSEDLQAGQKFGSLTIINPFM